MDAAAQVAAWRPDLIEEAPRSLDEVDALAATLARRGLSIAVPLKQIDVFCLFLTLAANLGHPVREHDGEVVPDGVFGEVLTQLRRLHRLSLPGSETMNPIDVFELMSDLDDIAYAPFLFGYSNYTRPGRRRTIRVADIPGVASEDCSGSCLGGVGIGVSSRCARPDIAAAYALYLCEPAYQASHYVRSGGQPASLSAWSSEHANYVTQGFFRDTLQTLERSYLRPRFRGFMDIARRVGPLLVEHLTSGSSGDMVQSKIRQGFNQSGNVVSTHA